MWRGFVTTPRQATGRSPKRGSHGRHRSNPASDPAPRFSGVVERTLAGSRPTGTSSATRLRRLERPTSCSSDRRCRVRQPEHVRRSDRYAELHPDGRRGPALQPIPCDGDLFADAGALLTGRNSHAVGFGSIGEFAGGDPGYSAILPRDCAPLPGSFAITVTTRRRSASGTTRRTTSRGRRPVRPLAERMGLRVFYGILGGGASQWDPVLAENQTIIGVPPNYGDPDRPFYLPTHGGLDDRVAGRRPGAG